MDKEKKRILFVTSSDLTQSRLINVSHNIECVEISIGKNNHCKYMIIYERVISFSFKTLE